MQVVLCGATIGAFLAATWYASIARQQQRSMEGAVAEAKRSNDLQARLIKGTYGVTFDPDAPVSEDGSIGLIFMNRGKVISGDLHATGNIVLESLPAYQPIGTPVPITADGKQIDIGRFAMSRVHFNQLTKAHLKRISEWKEALSIQGTVKYDNGFGDEVSSPFCFLYVRSGTTGDGTAVLRSLPCDVAKEVVMTGPQLLRATTKQ